jgi:hypothetical protein
MRRVGLFTHGEMHIFERWDLTKELAMLMGMNVLGLLDAFTLTTVATNGGCARAKTRDERYPFQEPSNMRYYLFRKTRLDGSLKCGN